MVEIGAAKVYFPPESSEALVGMVNDDGEILLYAPKGLMGSEHERLGVSRTSEKIKVWYQLQFPDLDVYWGKYGLLGKPDSDKEKVRERTALKEALKGKVPGLISDMDPLNLPLSWAAQKVERLVKMDGRWTKPVEYRTGYAGDNWTAAT